MPHHKALGIDISPPKTSKSCTTKATNFGFRLRKFCMLDAQCRQCHCINVNVRAFIPPKLHGTEQEGQHPLTGQRAANFKLLANQRDERRLVTQWRQGCCAIIIFLRDQDFPLTGSNFGNLTAFRAIFSHIFTAHVQERPFMNFPLKFWHHHSIPWSRFPYRTRYFGDKRTFSIDFCTG